MLILCQSQGLLLLHDGLHSSSRGIYHCCLHPNRFLHCLYAQLRLLRWIHLHLPHLCHQLQPPRHSMCEQLQLPSPGSPQHPAVYLQPELPRIPHPNCQRSWNQHQLNHCPQYRQRLSHSDHAYQHPKQSQLQLCRLPADQHPKRLDRHHRRNACDQINHQHQRRKRSP